jgi:hypothetical protein
MVSTKKSTSTNLILYFTNVFGNMESREQVNAIYTGISKDFDNAFD